MVILFFGMHSVHRTSVVGPATCRACGRQALQELTKHGTRLTVFFIPIWTFGRRYRVTCSACGGQVPVNRGEAAALERG